MSPGRRDPGESLPELPPLNLGLQGADDPPAHEPMDDDGPDGRHHWRWWLALGVALVVGAAGGVIGANARHDAIERNRIDLMATAISPYFDGSDLSADGVGQLEVNLVNLGSRPVEVVEIKIAGLILPDGGTPVDATTLEPGSWGKVRVRFEASCETREGMSRLEAVVRGDGGEQTVALDVPPGQTDVLDAWRWACTSGPGLMVESIQSLETEREEGRLTTQLEIRASGWRFPSRYVTAAQVEASGFHASIVDAPVKLAPNSVSQVLLEWTVTSCAEAANFSGISVRLLLADNPEGHDARAEDIWGHDILPMLVPVLAEACKS